ncbi:hypothetical protein PUN28_017149 [Cardiocondyla obscurior]|uniref:Uncharacterized protein n=1 Tax=Cardiocondyla obscurior TaxID=286306 RepID=A0AAW2EPC1_9HYME
MPRAHARGALRNCDRCECIRARSWVLGRVKGKNGWASKNGDSLEGRKIRDRDRRTVRPLGDEKNLRNAGVSRFFCARRVLASFINGPERPAALSMTGRAGRLIGIRYRARIRSNLRRDARAPHLHSFRLKKKMHANVSSLEYSVTFINADPGSGIDILRAIRANRYSMTRQLLLGFKLIICIKYHTRYSLHK